MEYRTGISEIAAYAFALVFYIEGEYMYENCWIWYTQNNGVNDPLLIDGQFGLYKKLRETYIYLKVFLLVKYK